MRMPGPINCPQGTLVSLDIHARWLLFCVCLRHRGRAICTIQAIFFTWPEGFNISGQVTNADDIPDSIGQDGDYGDVFGPQTTEYVVSGGDGKLAFAWFTALEDTPTGGGAGTVGTIDAYLVQYRILTDETDTDGNPVWGSWTT